MTDEIVKNKGGEVLASVPEEVRTVEPTEVPLEIKSAEKEPFKSAPKGSGLEVDDVPMA